MGDPPEISLLRRLLPIGEVASLEEISDQTGLQRSELLFLVHSLEQTGFVFRKSEGEISLLEEPDCLVPQAIRARLRTTTFGRNVVVLRETSSTNDRARQAGLSGAAEGWTVFAESQTAGRGTYGRKWISVAGAGLWFSVLLRSRIEPTQLSRLVRLAAVACAEAIERSIGRAVQIKLPNDLMLENGKFAGFLLETSSGWDFQVLGIGINVRSAPWLPDRSTAALEQFSSAGIGRNALAAELLDGLESWYYGKSEDQVERAFENRLI